MQLPNNYENNPEETLPDKTELLKQIESLTKQVKLLSNRLHTLLPSSPPASQIDPNITALLPTLMETQKLLPDRQINAPNVLQIISTNNFANSIKIFKGDAIDNALEWLKAVKRISTLVH